MKTNIKKNIGTVSAPAFTHEGAPAVRTNALLQLRRSVLATMLWEDSFYEDGQEISDRITSLITKVDPKKVASLAVEARTTGKLRHVPLLIARSMAPLPQHRQYLADTLAEIIQRPDELGEFLSIYWKTKKQPLSAQVKKGLARAFNKFDEYQLAKYNRDAEIKLRDVLFLTHATPVDTQQEELWKRLIGGYCAKCYKRQDKHKGIKHEFIEAKLATPDTWEVALSDSQGENKKDVWERLLAENKLSGLALLRNLRNFKETGVDEKLVRKALASMKVDRILPYRFITAAKYAPNLEPELEKAMFKAIDAKGKKIKGKTLLVLDVSGSMDEKLSAKSESTRLDAANGLAILGRELFEDVEIFSFSTGLVEVPNRRGFALRDAIMNSQAHGGTNLGSAISTLNSTRKYDRIIVFTDEQSHDTVGAPLKGATGYMVNVASNKNGVGYGAWNHIDGFSEAILDYIIEYEKLQTE